jgi:hypothetical protein
MRAVTANEAALLQAAILQKATAVAACELAIIELLREAQERPELRPLAERVCDLACAVSVMQCAA